MPNFKPVRKKLTGLLLKSLAALLMSCAVFSGAGAAGLKDTAALVNGNIISVAEYRAELARVLRLSRKTEQDLDVATLAMTKKEALETLIGRELLYQESQSEGIAVRDEELADEVAMLRKQFASESDFSASLAKLGLTRDGLMRQIRRGKAIQALTEFKFNDAAVVSESEARTYYDNHQDAYRQPARVRLSHILVKSGTLVYGNGITSARSKIEQFHRRLLAGEEFAVLAKESDDGKSSSIGGDLGYFTPGQLGKSMDAAAFSLEAGQVSPIVEDRFGYHILKVTERRAEGVIPFADVWEKISSQLRREQLLEAVTPYLKRLRDAAKVEIQLVEE